MGVIQGSINQMLATGAAAAAGAKHFKEQEALKTDAALETLSKEGDTMKSLSEEQDKLMAEQEHATKESEAAKSLWVLSPEDVFEKLELTGETMDQKERADKAMQAFQTKAEAKRQMFLRARKQAQKAGIKVEGGNI